MRDFRFFLLTAGGLGHAPIASGTFGSLPPVILAFILVQLGQPNWLVSLCMALLVVAFSVVCIRFGAFLHNALLAIGAFLAFRFFDILKPPPARSLERLGGGTGILVDDLITGAMALVVVQVVARLVA